MDYIFSAIQKIALLAPGFLLAITVHEFTHGYVAYKLGDPTAKLAGRLTFNPISHLDPFGTVVLLLTQFIGWAKPVPVDPRYLRNPKNDMIWISLGGPAANLLTAMALSMARHLLVLFTDRQTAGVSGFFLGPLMEILFSGIQINVILAIFNLIPVPPLDGAKILEGLLPRKQAYQFSQLEPYGPIILIVLIISNVTNYLVVPPFLYVMRLLVPGLS
jgi:Zn-dependent protease